MSAIANDRYLIATGTKIEPRIYRTQAEAESAAEALAYRTGKEVGAYRLSDAGCVSMWVAGLGHVTRFDLVVIPPDRAFRPDGNSWLDAPAEGKP